MSAAAAAAAACDDSPGKDYVIAVRTYKRPTHFQANTLAVIRSQGLLERLYVFVGSDIEEYKVLEPDLRYIPVPVGGKNAIAAICDYFPRSHPILFLDDDFADFKQYDHRTDSFIGTGLHEIILDGFKHAPFSFGFLRNKHWLRGTPVVRPNYGCMTGGAFGAFNEPELITTTHSHLDDTLRAIQYMKIGRVPFLYPGVSFKTIYGKTEGGLQSSGDRDDTKKVCEEVADQIEGWCKEIVKHKAGPYAWKWNHPSRIKKKVAEIRAAIAKE